LQAAHEYETPLRVGAAGGIGTPQAAAAALAMGAAYLVTGTVNQACVEAGTSAAVREMLAAAQQADVAMAPAADMFEMGVKLQVLKRGTMFAMRAAKLFELYRAHDSLDAIPPVERQSLEKTLFRQSLDDVWRKTREYFEPFDRAQVERAERDAKHKMALVFRWYLGLSSHWANHGDPSRQVDYQIWCGPAMGAFNEWTRGTFLERPGNRRVAEVGLNLMYGAAVCLRGQVLRGQGVNLTQSVGPRSANELERYV
jgi:PfaD family protein